MEISKYTHKVAAKNQIVLELYQNKEMDRTEIWFWEIDNDTEPMFIYSNTETGLFFSGNGYFNNKEELPHWISNDKKLRELIRFAKSSL